MRARFAKTRDGRVGPGRRGTLVRPAETKGIRRMLRNGLRFLALMTALSPAALAAAPVTLKLSFFTSDRSGIYQCQIRPLVEAVNAEGAGLVEIEVLFSGALSASMTDQPKLVRDGAA